MGCPEAAGRRLQLVDKQSYDLISDQYMASVEKQLLERNGTALRAKGVKSKYAACQRTTLRKA
jgi:hypothetical protein